jgi:hypothetical protein
VHQPDWRRLPPWPGCQPDCRLEIAKTPAAGEAQAVELGIVDKRRLDAYRKLAKEIESGKRF